MELANVCNDVLVIVCAARLVRWNHRCKMLAFAWLAESLHTRIIQGSWVLSGRLSTRKLKLTICRSPVPVTEEMTRGLVRMSMICGDCTQGIIGQVPSSYTSSKIPLNLSNMTPRSPPSTAHIMLQFVRWQQAEAQR
jgi:hypothetical protein